MDNLTGGKPPYKLGDKPSPYYYWYKVRKLFEESGFQLAELVLIDGAGYQTRDLIEETREATVKQVLEIDENFVPESLLAVRMYQRSKLKVIERYPVSVAFWHKLKAAQAEKESKNV